MKLRVRFLWLIFIAMAAPSIFGQAAPLDLADLVRLATNSSPMALKAALETEAARAELDIARSSFFPKISTNLAATWLAVPPGDFVMPANTFAPGFPEEEIVITESPDFDFRLELGLQQPVFTWGKLLDAARIAEAGLELSLLNKDLQTRNLARDVESAYLGLALAARTADLVDQMTSLYTRIHEDRQRNFEQGLIAREQVLESSANLASIRQSRAAAFAALSSALDGLRALSGLGQELGLDRPGYTAASARYLLTLPDELWSPARLPALLGIGEAELADIHLLFPQILASLQERSRMTSEELRIADLRSKQAVLAAEISSKKDGLLPDLGLSVNLGVNGSKLPGAENWDQSWSATLTVTLGTSITLTDGGAAWARTRAAQSQADLAGLGSTSSRTRLDATVSQSLEAAVAAHFSASAARAALDHASETLKNAEISFENQLLTREQVLGAQLARLQRELDFLAASWAAESRVADLESLTGKNVQ